MDMMYDDDDMLDDDEEGEGDAGVEIENEYYNAKGLKKTLKRKLIPFQVLSMKI